ncbi:MAG: hypothetical protein FJ086_00775 [Deltaproteobacteria bacterium]|nr:hypothetical protein [Deltaproteobacteria bacterium]
MFRPTPSLTLAAALALAGMPALASPQPRLKAARDNLETAPPDKGGRRVKALKLVDDAVREVEAAVVAEGGSK